MGIFSENSTIITGASMGIGRALALQLAGKGAWLTLAARNEAKLDETAALCRERGGRAEVVRTDVAVRQQCEHLIQKCVSAYGRIDTLINNAGITLIAPFEEVTDISLYEKVMQVNFLGAVYCTYYALPHLKETRGRLAAINSLAGLTGVPSRSAYSASKFALNGFFDTLRIEQQDNGVSVTMIYPGFTNTEIRRVGFRGDGQRLTHDPIKKSKTMTPEECARRIIVAVERRKRQVIMTSRAKVGKWLKIIAPETIDRLAKRATERGG
jgi:short-subunit dehydrogenase